MVWTQRVRDALVRTYATTTKIPKHFAYQDKRKGFSERKTFLFNKYQRMMRENELVVPVSYTHLTLPTKRIV